MKFHVLDTGYCTANEAMVRRGARRKAIRCHALVLLVEHPREGWILIDTGYAPRFLAATGQFPESIYRRAIPVPSASINPVVDQLPRFGLCSSDIRYVFVSHFHADHVAGLHDFPTARLICSRQGYEDLCSRRRWSGLARAYLPALIPSDLKTRTMWVEQFSDDELPGLGPTHDLFGDETFRVVSLPGHARGQIGVLLATSPQPLLFVADGCWQAESYRQLRGPHWLTYTFIDNRRQMLSTLRGIHQFNLAQPSIPIIATHCPEAFAQFIGDNNDSAESTAANAQSKDAAQ